MHDESQGWEALGCDLRRHLELQRECGGIHWSDPASRLRLYWCRTSAPRTQKSVVTTPTTLAIAGTYLIFSEVSYSYTPSVGYMLKGSMRSS